MNCVMVDLWIGFFNDPRDRIGAPLLFYRCELIFHVRKFIFLEPKKMRMDMQGL